MADDRTGLLIIRAWTEEGSSEPLRFQVRSALDVTVGFDSDQMLCRTEAVCAAVREWLDDIGADTEA